MVIFRLKEGGKEMRRKWTLKACRVNKDLTLGEVSSIVGVTEKTLSSWERGLTPIPLHRFNTLCDLYEVDKEEVNIPVSRD